MSFTFSVNEGTNPVKREVEQDVLVCVKTPETSVRIVLEIEDNFREI